MKNYSGFEWLLIDCANQFGLDKLTFEDRIQWATTHLDTLEALADQGDAKHRPQYLKAVMAIRKAQAGLPTGHLVAVDATCSGIQIMSAMTGCITGATATGLVDPDVRADAYTRCTELMNEILGSNLSVVRNDAKAALMTSFYGSRKRPKDIFGKGTPELSAFYQAAFKLAPGAWELLQDLIAAWQPFALVHAWKLPDGYAARVKVMEKKTVRLEVDELDHATFSYTFRENVGSKEGISLPANVVHSMDAYVLREMHRRCNYDRAMVEHACLLLANEASLRATLPYEVDPTPATGKIGYYVAQYQRSTLASAAILPHLTAHDMQALSNKHVTVLLAMVKQMLNHRPFSLVTVHDAFASHANNVNQVRFHYKEILAEIAESTVLDDILSQIHGNTGTFTKLSSNLGDLIRQSNYALC